LNRFDTDTKNSFLEFYQAIDASINPEVVVTPEPVAAVVEDPITHL
jgi:hypothetical protein